jgi:glycosyltransferase involved in cell wall biosynthesis
VVAAAFAVPGGLDQPTGGYAYDRRVIAELRRHGCEVEVIDLGAGFPHPAAEAAREAGARLRQVPAGRPVIIDGLALGVLPGAAQELAATHPLIAVVHHPLALETGITCETAAVLRQSERAALAAVRHVIVTSPATARVLVADYGVTAATITVVRPGNDPAPHAPPATRQADRHGTLNLLAVGAVVPRKGYDVLIEALALITDLDWHLTIAGDCTRDRATAAALATRLVLLRLGPRVRMTGAVGEDELIRLYRDADLFVLASHHEGYGMAFAEAINHGLPVVGTKAGAIAETVPEGAGLLVPPGNIAALAAALRTMIADGARRARAAAAARRGAADLPNWEAAGRAFLDVLRVLS